MTQRPRPAESSPDTERYWEERYRDRAQFGRGRPNAVLVDLVLGLPAGTALDLGCGLGGDAVWLARQGWHVTAVDVSPTALARVRADAADAGLGSQIRVAHL